jgi:hypothetical protein
LMFLMARMSISMFICQVNVRSTTDLTLKTLERTSHRSCNSQRATPED